MEIQIKQSKDITKGFGRGIKETAASGSVRSDNEPGFVHLDQDFLEGVFVVIHILLKLVLHLGANNQGEEGNEGLSFRDRVAVNVEALHVNIVFEGVKAFFHHITAAVDIQDLRRRLFET